MIILRGLWCVFCFHTVFKDDLESGAKLAAGWAWWRLGRAKSFIGVLASPAAQAASLRLFVILKQRLRNKSIVAIPSSTPRGWNEAF